MCSGDQIFQHGELPGQKDVGLHRKSWSGNKGVDCLLYNTNMYTCTKDIVIEFCVHNVIKLMVYFVLAQYQPQNTVM